eukprot:TRINITY_DN20022_c0_g1_i1.p1 TRINITY_DN20022_c0_g1~~TRINITY_DN20022_c0_g1_i1.p1  ORF type:complete len:660 (+),score=86.12 TRINITY_DN20022_c0_g1_i1:92-2071(+)
MVRPAYLLAGCGVAVLVLFSILAVNEEGPNLNALKVRNVLPGNQEGQVQEGGKERENVGGSSVGSDKKQETEVPAELKYNPDHTIPDPMWRGGDRKWNLEKGSPTQPARYPKNETELAESQNYNFSELWRGDNRSWDVPQSTPNSTHGLDTAFYFYDDSSNHSAWVLSNSIRLTEPNIKLESLYIDRSRKTDPYWHYIVKGNLIIKAIKANWGKKIVVMDTDMVFWRPWAAEMGRMLNYRDILFQGIDHGSTKSQSAMSSIVISIMAMRCSDTILQFFETMLWKMTCGTGNRWMMNKFDQNQVIKQLKRRSPRVRWAMLPSRYWGSSLSLRMSSRKKAKVHRIMPSDAVMCHVDNSLNDERNWNSKLESKYYQILSRECFSDYLIDTSRPENSWWVKNSFMTHISTLTTPLAYPVHVNSSVIVYSNFYPDEWTRFSTLVSLKMVEPSLGSQLAGGHLTIEHMKYVLSNRPVGSVTYFCSSQLIFFYPFADAVRKAFRERGDGPPYDFVHAGPQFMAVMKYRNLSAADTVSGLPEEGRNYTSTQKEAQLPEEKRLPRNLFHSISESENATAESLLCVADQFLNMTYPHYHTYLGLLGPLALEEMHFHTLGNLQCNRPYEDPFHSTEHYVAAGKWFWNCGQLEEEQKKEAQNATNSTDAAK